MTPRAATLALVLGATISCGGGGGSADDATSSGTAGHGGAGSNAGAGGAPGGAGGSTAGFPSNGGTSGGAGATGSAGLAGAGGAAGSDGIAGKAGAAGTSGGAGAAGSAGLAGKAGAAGQAGSAGAPVDPCASKTVACASPPAGMKQGSGVHEIDRCAFPLGETSAWSTMPPLADALSKVAKKTSLAAVLADTNRDAAQVASVPGKPAGTTVAFRWDADDFGKEWWIPQGLSGSPDADASGLVEGKKVLLVSWYHDEKKQPGATETKGVRLSFVDVTDPASPTYRHVLLVRPTGSVSAPDIAPVDLHAGGIVWFKNWIYVADTKHGFRVFDTSRIFEVDTGSENVACTATTCSAGTYRYILPQVGAYEDLSACDLLFSWVSLARTPSPRLVSGEYCGALACSGPLAGRVVTWPLDEATGKIASPKVWASSAAYFAERQVQGGAIFEGRTLLSSSAPAGGAGALYRVVAGKSATSAWIDSPEDLMLDAKAGLLWGLSEVAGTRFVVGAKLSSYPAP